MKPTPLKEKCEKRLTNALGKHWVTLRNLGLRTSQKTPIKALTNATS